MSPYRGTQGFRDQQADARDRDPLIDCEVCGEATRWSDLARKPKHPLDDTLNLCKSCDSDMKQFHHRSQPVEKRREENATIDSFETNNE